jgi:hypothetical protein
VLFNKEDTDTPEIDRIRPINILPTITKLLEGAIMHNLGILTKTSMFSRYQRGFLKNKSSLNNIYEVLEASRKLQLPDT